MSMVEERNERDGGPLCPLYVKDLRCMIRFGHQPRLLTPLRNSTQDIRKGAGCSLSFYFTFGLNGIFVPASSFGIEEKENGK